MNTPGCTSRALTAPILQRLPVTPAIVYLAVGLLVGPTVLNLFHFNPLMSRFNRYRRHLPPA